MRVDARSLLQRLGKREFVYREFAGRFSELELWPLFDAVLHDPLLAGGGALATAPAPLRHPSPGSPPPRPAGSDVRDLLRELSALAAKGDL